MLVAALVSSRCYADSYAEIDDQVARGISRESRPVVFWTIMSMSASSQAEVRATGQRAADALIVTGAATTLLKRLTNMPRPASDDPRLVKLGLAPPPDGKGFPSGHASAAFAFATVMANADRENRYLWYGLAGMVGWSRVEVGAHHVWDVVAGAALGSYIGSRSLHSDGGLLGVVGLEPKRIKWGESILTLGPTLTSSGISLATLEF